MVVWGCYYIVWIYLYCQICFDKNFIRNIFEIAVAHNCCKYLQTVYIHQYYAMEMSLSICLLSITCL